MRILEKDPAPPNTSSMQDAVKEAATEALKVLRLLDKEEVLSVDEVKAARWWSVGFPTFTSDIDWTIFCYAELQPADREIFILRIASYYDNHMIWSRVKGFPMPNVHS